MRRRAGEFGCEHNEKREQEAAAAAESTHTPMAVDLIKEEQTPSAPSGEAAATEERPSALRTLTNTCLETQEVLREYSATMQAVRGRSPNAVAKRRPSTRPPMLKAQRVETLKELRRRGQLTHLEPHTSGTCSMCNHKVKNDELPIEQTKAAEYDCRHAGAIDTESKI